MEPLDEFAATRVSASSCLRETKSSPFESLITVGGDRPDAYRQERSLHCFSLAWPSASCELLRICGGHSQHQIAGETLSRVVAVVLVAGEIFAGSGLLTGWPRFRLFAKAVGFGVAVTWAALAVQASFGDSKWRTADVSGVILLSA